MPRARARSRTRPLVPGSIPSRALLTATVTDAAGNTSEFSAPLEAPLVTKTWGNASGGNWSVPEN